MEDLLSMYFWYCLNKKYLIKLKTVTPPAGNSVHSDEYTKYYIYVCDSHQYMSKHEK
jgi:hypothetical protein